MQRTAQIRTSALYNRLARPQQEAAYRLCSGLRLAMQHDSWPCWEGVRPCL